MKEIAPSKAIPQQLLFIALTKAHREPLN